jgi:N-acylglucosamine 2-epimerase
MDFKAERTFLYNHLMKDIVQFWVEHAVDRKNGGIYCLLRDDGTVVKGDKPLVQNARALWTFSALANRFGAERSWVEAADGIYEFLVSHGRTPEGRWNYVVDEYGAPIQGPASIITDAFAIYGLVEYYRLTRNREALSIAEETCTSCLERLARPGSYGTSPYPTPKGMKAHREAMQFSLMFFELWKERKQQKESRQEPAGQWQRTEAASLRNSVLYYSNEVLEQFYKPEKQALLEYIGIDNQFRDTPEGRAMVPGHGIESFWFQIHIRGSEELGHYDAAHKAAHAMQCCFERGWDPVYGGLYLGIDIHGKQPPYWKFAETKRWWPHTESLCGALLAYEQIREQWCLEWYTRTRDWAFEHFPDREHGDWVQNLDREGRPLFSKTPESENAGANTRAEGDNGATREWIQYDLYTKDFFHLPRALIFCIETLDRLSGEQ